MAAQKLTKGRFVQIIIMLTLLIVAFFWRTFTYQGDINIDCTGQKTCSFKVNGATFEATKTDKMLLLETQATGWIIQEIDKQDGEQHAWQIPFNPKQTLLLTNSQQQTISVVLSFE